MHVPALKPKPFAEDERLKEISELPEWSRKAFAGMRSLNRIQSRVCNAALFSAENLLLCAPTGAGKTNVAMLTILHEVRGARGVRRWSQMRSLLVVCSVWRISARRACALRACRCQEDQVLPCWAAVQGAPPGHLTLCVASFEINRAHPRVWLLCAAVAALPTADDLPVCSAHARQVIVRVH